MDLGNQQVLFKKDPGNPVCTKASTSPRYVRLELANPAGTIKGLPVQELV